METYKGKRIVLSKTKELEIYEQVKVFKDDPKYFMGYVVNRLFFLLFTSGAFFLLFSMLVILSETIIFMKQPKNPEKMIEFIKFGLGDLFIGILMIISSNLGFEISLLNSKIHHFDIYKKSLKDEGILEIDKDNNA